MIYLKVNHLIIENAINSVSLDIFIFHNLIVVIFPVFVFKVYTEYRASLAYDMVTSRMKTVSKLNNMLWAEQLTVQLLRACY